MSWQPKSFFRCDRSACREVPAENIVMIRPPMMSRSKQLALADEPNQSEEGKRSENGVQQHHRVVLHLVDCVHHDGGEQLPPRLPHQPFTPSPSHQDAAHDVLENMSSRLDWVEGEMALPFDKYLGEA